MLINPEEKITLALWNKDFFHDSLTSERNFFEGRALFFPHGSLNSWQPSKKPAASESHRFNISSPSLKFLSQCNYKIA
jgi:hypothetical protein